MTESSQPFVWRVLAESVRGASHERAGTTNQDRYAVKSAQSGKVVAAAVADGHGNRKSFRSHRGAGYAVEAAIEQLQAFASQALRTSDQKSVFRQAVSVELPQRIVRNWQDRVDVDIEGEAFSIEELTGLSDSELAAINTNRRIVYGTTLIAVMVLPTCIVYLQLGDGDLIVITEACTVPTRPLPADPRSFASETVSLSSQEGNLNPKRPSGGGGPWSDFRVKVLPTTVDPPILILLTTDGYPNAFVDDSAFQKVATDILAMGRDEGWGFVSDHLSEWLEEASRRGSGDDVTVVLLVRNDPSETPGVHEDRVESNKTDDSGPASVTGPHNLSQTDSPSAEQE